MTELRSTLERGVGGATPPPDGLERLLRRRDRKRRNQRIGAIVIAIAFFAIPVWILASGARHDIAPTPGESGAQVPASFAPFPGAPGVDYVFDLRSGGVRPLPDPIIASLGRSAGGREGSDYAVSRDGSQLAYVGTADDGSMQILVAGIDGAGVHQVTHDPEQATSPAWSPDGAKIAYIGYGSGAIRNLFLLDVATGAATQLTAETVRTGDAWWPQFTPDGASIMYTGGSWHRPELRIVSINGGESTLVIGQGIHGRMDAMNGSLSPDGSLVTFMGSDADGFGAFRFVAGADGSGWRQIPGGESEPSGTWSPDGNWIVCPGFGSQKGQILAVDVATGIATHVADGRQAIWLDSHTLLVEV